MKYNSNQNFMAYPIVYVSEDIYYFYALHSLKGYLGSSWTVFFKS